VIESVQINEYTIISIVYPEETKGKGTFMDLMTTSEMAKVWGISSRRVALLCSQGRVEGAVKKGKTWLIPSNAQKPKAPRTHK
jgi:hypothetical protein